MRDGPSLKPWACFQLKEKNRCVDSFAKKLSHRFDGQVSFSKPTGIVATALPKESWIAPDQEMILRVLRQMRVQRKDYAAFFKTEFYARLLIVDEAFVTNAGEIWGYPGIF